LKRLALLLCTCLLGTATILTTGSASGSALVAAPLHTSGNQILDSSNNPVMLRGLTRVAVGTKPITDDEIGHVRQWGANVVRVTLDEDAWNQLCLTSSYDPDYRSEIDDIVSSITSRGMVALLELSVNPRFICDPRSHNRQKLADYPGGIIFWQNVAKRYMSNPLVAFELYNEPNNISTDVWRNGGIVSDGAIRWQAAGMQQMYNAIRGVSAQNLVFIDGLNWGATPPTSLLNGYNIVYAAHMYTCPQAPPPNCTYPQKIGPMGLITIKVPVPNPDDPTPIFTRWAPLAATQPVAITEFGWPDQNDGTYMANVVAAAEQHGWSWMAYAWLGSPSGTFNLLLNCGSGANYDPTPSGVPIKQGLSVNP
jgi:hypothetical protein